MPVDSTRDVVIRNYSSITGRSIQRSLSPAVMKMQFRSFDKSLGRLLPKEKSASILDVACGEGVFLAYLRSKGYTNLHGFDLSPECVQICHTRGFTFVEVADVLDWVENESRNWDVAFMLDVLEHLPRQRVVALLRLLRSRLAPHGFLVLQTPNMAGVCACWYRYGDVTHEIGYTERSIVAVLRAAGFQSIDVLPAWNATTGLGRVREVYVRLRHFLVYVGESAPRPKIPTANLLAKAVR